MSLILDHGKIDRNTLAREVLAQQPLPTAMRARAKHPSPPLKLARPRVPAMHGLATADVVRSNGQPVFYAAVFIFLTSSLGGGLLLALLSP